VSLALILKLDFWYYGPARSLCPPEVKDGSLLFSSLLFSSLLFLVDRPRDPV
jgi:hypothetical protein